jgi:2-iminoacetate synthase
MNACVFTAAIAAKTEQDVLRALQKEHCNVDDFMALISPAAEPYLEQMARLSRRYTEERFGRTVSMFIPLYLTNSCTNSCVYCGFHVANKMKRTILTPEEMVKEYEAIKQLGPFENLLIVTDENPALAGTPYLAKALDLAKPYFSNLKIEVMPLSAEDYKELTHHGMNGVICFQETYHRENYKLYHPRGTLACSMMMRRKSRVCSPRLVPIGAPSGMTAAAPASSRCLHRVGSAWQ